MSANINLKIPQGGTFKYPIRLESDIKVYRQISNILNSAPVEISTIEAHGAPEGWRVTISGVQGMKEINSEHYATISNTLPGSFQINTINALNYTAYTKGGVVEYNKPVDIAGYSGRLQIRKNISSEDVLLSIDSETGGIIIDEVNCTITINLLPAQTKELDFSRAVYSLEIESPEGEVYTVISGYVQLTKEVTR